MSYYEAKEDNVRIERKNGFTVYLPPCSVCGKPVKSWSYIRGNRLPRKLIFALQMYAKMRY